MSEVSFRIKFRNVTPGVWGAVQEGKGSTGKPNDLQKLTGGDAEWVVNVALRNGQPSGAFAQKDSKGSFIYILWGTSAGQYGSAVTRRAKVYLPPALEEGGAYAVEFDGQDKFGLPACASLKPVVDWTQI